jgi:outer membrane protein
VRMNELMGREQDLEFRVADTISVNRSLDFEELKTRSTEQNTELAIARLERRIADLNRRELRSQRLPEIELFSGYDYNRTDGGGGFMQFNETQGFHIGLTARINLFDGFDMTRRIQNAEIEQRNRQLQFMEASDRLDAGLLAAWLRYQNSLELVDLEEENLIHADERMEIALERFREGVISALEFRESQRVFLDARERLLQALYDAKVAESSLLRLSGDLGDLAI